MGFNSGFKGLICSKCNTAVSYAVPRIANCKSGPK